MNTTAGWVLGWSLALAPVAPAASEAVYGWAEVTAALGAPDARALSRQAAIAVERDDTVALAEVIAEASQLRQPARSVLVFDALLTLAGMPADASLNPLLDRHAESGEHIRLAHHDEGHRAVIDAYDARAAARFVLRTWRRSGARDEALADLARGALFSREKAPVRRDEATLAGQADALATAPLAQLPAVRDEVAGALERGEPVEPLALVLIERLNDTTLATTALEHGAAHALVPALPRIAAALVPDDAFAVFAAATARPEVASAAVAQIGITAATVPAARAWLLAALGDPTLGASAASALARIEDPAVVGELATPLYDRDRPRAQARAALALKLAGTPEALAVLASFARDPAAPAGLRDVIRQWLR